MNHMTHFPADLASRSAGLRSGDRPSHDRKNPAGAGRVGFTRPVWPFLVAAKRDQEKPQVSGNPDPLSFSS
jgi:hypothetical protein